MSEQNLVSAIRDALQIELARDERQMIVGLDVGKMGGVFRATDGLQAEFGEDRVVDLPIAEGVMVGAAIGLCVSGFRPIVEMQFLGFGHQAFHQIGQQLTRLRQRSQGRFSAPLTIRAPYGGGGKTPEFHSDCYEALYAQCPGLRVVAPSSATEAKGLLLAALRHPDPVLFLEPIAGYRTWIDDVPEGDYVLPLGEARIAYGDEDAAAVAVVSYGLSTRTALRAAESLAAAGIGVVVVDLRSLSPLDVGTLCRVVEKTGRCVVVTDAPVTGSVASEVTATLMERVFWSLEAPIVRVGAPDVPHPLGALEQFYIPTAEAVADAVRSTLEAR